MLITEVGGEEESVPRFSHEDSTVGGGFNEDPTNQDLIQIPQGGGAGCMCVGGAGRGEKSMVPATRAEAPAQ